MVVGSLKNVNLFFVYCLFVWEGLTSQTPLNSSYMQHIGIASKLSLPPPIPLNVSQTQTYDFSTHSWQKLTHTHTHTWIPLTLHYNPLLPFSPLTCQPHFSHSFLAMASNTMAGLVAGSHTRNEMHVLHGEVASSSSSFSLIMGLVFLRF